MGASDALPRSVLTLGDNPSADPLSLPDLAPSADRRMGEIHHAFILKPKELAMIPKVHYTDESPPYLITACPHQPKNNSPGHSASLMRPGIVMKTISAKISAGFSTPSK